MPSRETVTHVIKTNRRSECLTCGWEYKGIRASQNARMHLRRNRAHGPCQLYEKKIIRLVEEERS